jgi:hypothetical protein
MCNGCLASRAVKPRARPAPGLPENVECLGPLHPAQNVPEHPCHVNGIFHMSNIGDGQMAPWHIIKQFLGR